MSNLGRYEREFVNTLDSIGYGIMRCPGSGGGTDRELPDVLVGRPRAVPRESVGPLGVRDVSGRLSELWAVEHKSGQDTTLYVTAREVEDLREFADAWGARVLLGARFKRQNEDRRHYLVPPENARMTDGGNYGLPESDIEDRAVAVVNATTGEVRHL